MAFVCSLLLSAAFASSAHASHETEISVPAPELAAKPAPPPIAALKPAAATEPRPNPSRNRTPIRGIHLTGWVAGFAKARRQFIAEAKKAGLNAVVIALKEYDGRMFVRGVAEAKALGSYVNAIPDLPAAVRDFKAAGLYTVGRIVLFKDDWLARRRPDWAVRKPDGSLWTNDKGVAWVDPYRREVWEYNLAIAERAAAAGFDEIQFDYIRFPSDGNTALCRYSRRDHGDKTAARNLRDFLALAGSRLRPRGVKLSICVFGMTTSDDSGMGIGQHIAELVQGADFVSPMMYPSHYSKGQYGIRNPNREPYKTIHLGLRDATRKLGGLSPRLRPYLQDFSLGWRYRAEQVRAQILAAARMGVTDWVLWNPQNHYTWAAIPSEEQLKLHESKSP
ncbi:MAG: GTP-binding protein [Elusimicrobia bacterium]|nr:GTP-binding protein [Elusimicrobiota bacterium]